MPPDLSFEDLLRDEPSQSLLSFLPCSFPNIYNGSSLTKHIDHLSELLRSLFLSFYLSLAANMASVTLSVRSAVKAALKYSQYALIFSQASVHGGSPPVCSNPQLSCQNTTAVQDTCCFNAPGGQLLQTQFWDTNPPTGPTNSWTVHGLWCVSVTHPKQVLLNLLGLTTAMAPLMPIVIQVGLTPTSHQSFQLRGQHLY